MITDNTKYETAIKYLSNNPLLNMGMIVPLKRNTVDMIYVDIDGVCFKEIKSGAYMLSVSSYKTGCKILEHLPDNGLFSFNQSFMLDVFKSKVNYSTLLENYQAVYFNDILLPVSNSISIKALDISFLDIFIMNYDIDLGKDYICERINEKELFGGFVDDILIGFIGIHAEGSIGMLKVFDEYKRKGYGKALSIFAINHQLNRKIVPFEQIDIKNIASLSLAHSLGFTISTDCIYWLF